FSFPYGVAADGSGNLFVADSYNHTIRRIAVATGGVTTLAGTAGSSGSVDGIGAAARFYVPYGVAADGSGNLFVADTENHTIRRIVVATGEVTTLAGTAGSYGSVDGAGAAARFTHPYGVAADGSGNVLVADSWNHTIRRIVVATGEVTTLAGTAGSSGDSDGTGEEAQFGCPSGVAADGSGDVIVADTWNHTIRRIVVATRAVTTLAGIAGFGGSADGTGVVVRFKNPCGVAVDGGGNLFVADTANHTIRRIEVATGEVTTLAGTAGSSGSADGIGPAARFKNPYGVAADGMGNVFVADTNNHTIRRIVVATGEVTTLAGRAGSYGSVDGVGEDHTIRRIVVATGEVTTLAGRAGSYGSDDGLGEDARFNGPSGVAVDGSGHLFVADTSNHKIRRIVVATGEVTTLAGTAGSSGPADGTGAAARFSSPRGVATDGSGNLFVADTANHTIRRIVVATGEVTTLAGRAGSYGSVDGVGEECRGGRQRQPPRCGQLQPHHPQDRSGDGGGHDPGRNCGLVRPRRRHRRSGTVLLPPRHRGRRHGQRLRRGHGKLHHPPR
ncbi:MAG: hypothetical protein MUF10_13080, partial [Thermoanaerobaculaceae bacterium]|nr:hypothetical protein [Thermoanaerobaculaceae bacterium]